MSAETFDVIVLGGGIGGLSAALAAHEHGLRPVLIEKSEQVGGTTSDSYGLIWVGDNHLMQAAGADRPREDIVRYMTFLGGGELSEERMLDAGRSLAGGDHVLRDLRHPVPADRRPGRSLFRRGGGRARAGPHARGRAYFRVRSRRLARQGAHAEGRALFRDGCRAICLGRDQSLLHLGPGPGARAPRQGHARQGRRPGHALRQAVAQARRADPARHRGRRPDRRGRPRHRRADAGRRSAVGPQGRRARHRRLRMERRADARTSIRSRGCSRCRRQARPATG